MTSTTQEEVYSDFPVDLTGWLPPISPGFPWKWTWQEQDDNGQARDISNWTAEMDLRPTPAGRLYAKLSTLTGEITNGGATGIFSVTMTPAQTARFSPGAAVTNVKVTDDQAVSNNHFEATIEVKKIVTRT